MMPCGLFVLCPSCFCIAEDFSSSGLWGHDQAGVAALTEVCVWSLLVSCISKLLRDRLLLLVHSLFVLLYAGALFLLSWCFRSRETTRLIRDGPVHSLKLVHLEHTKHADQDD